ncbi:hypothetical protein FQZ97_1125760 [compost metagenome]
MASLPSLGIGNGTPGSAFSSARPPSATRVPTAFFAVLSSRRCGRLTVRCVGYTSTRKVEWRLSSSWVEAVSLPLNSAAFLPSITSFGFSLAKGSGRMELPCW